MFAALFVLIGGAAIAASFSEDMFETDQNEETEFGDEEFEEVSIGLGDTLENEEDFALMETDGPETSDKEVNFPNASADDIGNVEAEWAEISVDDLAHMPTPLSDWGSDSEVLVIEAGVNDSVALKFSDDVDGTLVVEEADYISLQGDHNSGPIHYHTGQNIYHLPEGEEFPEGYEWSEQAAAFFNMNGPDDPDHFAGIRLLARIEGGVFAIDTDQNGDVVILFDGTHEEPEIVSNIPIVHALR